ncbi:uncharacterized protein [Spinacia oleracea]|uniref:Pectinesterase inhibitor domain-containing protein n=1 Tax=Spinacia oleracea TaxID=3562 RepID=A0A9R0IQG6_SPIOL|nr:uncharacterized protein LOC110792794 [Spinacia oleracea]
MVKDNTSSALLVLSTLVLLLLLTPMVASEATRETQTKIDSICRSNEDYGFCNKVFQADIQQPDMDYVGLTKITIMEARKNASNTLGFIRAQIPGVKDESELNYYKVCENAYLTIKQSFDQAFDAFIKGDYTLMASDQRITPRVQANCVTIFTMSSVSENPLGSLNERNREMRILITMAIITASFIVP